MLSAFSELWAFLTLGTFEDGTRRQTGRLSFTCDVDLLGVSLQDDETGQYAYLNGRSLDDLLLEAELRLKEGTMPWRPSRYAGKAKR
jgi:hypothetical protein